ncbi:hypothetical protein Trydic_g10317 [Trypoxylus dichotomus]
MQELDKLNADTAFIQHRKRNRPKYPHREIVKPSSPLFRYTDIGNELKSPIPNPLRTKPDPQKPKIRIKGMELSNLTVAAPPKTIGG